MKKLVKIILYISGFALIIGVGIWSELNSGNYPRIEKEISKKNHSK